MAGGKETPRQKMIGMMYLVLTALLALNVSKEILNAFVLINDGLEYTNSNFEGKNQSQYNAFERAKQNDPGKVTEYYNKAMQVKQMADELDLHIDQLKKFLIEKTEGIPAEVADTLQLINVGAKDNYDVPTLHLIGDDNNNPKEGENTAKELKGKIIKFREDLLALLDPKIREQVKLPLNTDDPGMVGGIKETWETANFYHLPLAAVVTNLTKIQADIRNAEADLVSMLYSNISAEDFKFDTLAPKVIANTNYVLIGDTYRAEVIVAAFSTTQNPKLEAGKVDTAGNITDSTGAMITTGGGAGRFAFAPQSEGLIEWGGIISVKKPDGTYAPYNFKSSFIAAKPAVVISPTAMNVFYRGLDNPVEVSVPGVPAEKLKVTMSNGSLSGSKGKYNVRPGKGTTSVINVSAEMNGATQSFGKMEFRCKNVPNPVPYFAGQTGSSNVSKKQLVAAQGVSARMENFEFDLRFNVVSFTMSATIKGKVVDQAVRGGRVSGDMKKIIQALRPGQKVYIEKIKAKGPDGTVRDLGAIVLKVIG